MFTAFNRLGIEYYRIDTSLPLGAQKPVRAILHKLMFEVHLTIH